MARRDNSSSNSEGGTTRPVQDPKGKSVPPNDPPSVPSGAVVFNCPELIELRDGRVSLPTRVTCYSRHHGEQIGFQYVFNSAEHRLLLLILNIARLYFSLVDSVGHLIGEGYTTNPILVIDDHSNKRAQRAKASQSISLSPHVKRHPRRHQNPSSGQSLNSSERGNGTPTGGTGMTPSSDTSPSAPPAPSSSIPSLWLPTPSTYSSMDTLFSHQTSEVHLPAPKIEAINPVSGALLGCTIVTVIGENFTRQHRCVFGQFVCAWTKYWNEHALTCIVPPSSRPGTVLVTIEGFPVTAGGGGVGAGDGQDFQWYKYIADAEGEM